MQAHEFAELGEYLKEEGYPEEWVNSSLIENIPYYGKEFSIVELMERKGDFAIIEMEFDISKGSILLERLTGYLLNAPVPREELANLNDPVWREQHVLERAMYEELVPAYFLFDTLCACREISKDNPELILKYKDMNRNSLEDFRDQAKALKMPAVMQAEIEKQMESNVDRIAVTVKMPSRRGHLEATAHLKRGGGDSEYYYFNKYDLALNNKVKPLENDYEYMIRTTAKDGEKLEKPLLRSFDSPIAAIKYFKAQNGTSELLTGKIDGNKLIEGQSLATMQEGKVDYVSKNFQPTYHNPVVENTVYVNKGVGYNMNQSASMLQNGAAYRDDLVSRQGMQYAAWSIYKFDEPRDTYGNLKIRQYGEGYGFKLENELKSYHIKELEDPQKLSQIIAGMKDGERQLITAGLPNGETQKLYIEAIPRYGNLNFYDKNGEPQMREAFLKEDVLKENTLSKQLKQDKQKGQEAGLSI